MLDLKRLLQIFFICLYPLYNFICINFLENFSWLAIIITFLILFIASLFFYYVVRSFLSSRATLCYLAAGIFVFFSSRSLIDFWINYGNRSIDVKVFYALVVFSLFILLMLGVSKRLNVVSKGLTVFYVSLFVISTFDLVVGLSHVNMVKVEPHDDKDVVRTAFLEKPNLYYFLFDNYANEHSLKEILNIDNSDFIFELKNLGFYDVEHSKSNANNTHFSMPFIWGQEYYLKTETTYYGYEVADYVLNITNKTFTDFVSNGYTIYSNYPSKFPKVSRVKFQDNVFSDTLASIAFRTPIQGFISAIYSRFVTAVDEIFMHDNFLKNNSLKSPLFYYGHINSVHPPFFYNEECQYKANLGLQTDYSVVGYKNAIKCTRPLIVDFLKGIIERDPTAIIIVQSDHGSNTRNQLGKPWKDVDHDDLVERYSNITFFKLPQRCQKLLKTHMSAVNTFRVVEACLRGEDHVDYLPDRYFWLPDNYKKGYQVHEFEL